MRLSVERLRWILIAGAVLLVVALGALVGYGRYRAGKLWGNILKNSGATFTHDTNGVTYSQSDGKRTIFTVHAAKAIPKGQGVYVLQKAELTLYGRAPGETDHIYGNEFEYDEKQGIARALGEVDMELHTPASPRAQARPNPPKGQAADGSQTVHVHTSGLVYLRKLDVATTSDVVQFTWGDLQCESHGAEFHPDESTLHLLADVHMSGRVQGQPLDVKASEATLDRTLNVVELSHLVAVSGDRRAKADHAVVYLTNNGVMERAEGTGGVTLVSGTQTVTAERMDAAMSAASRPRTAKLSGGVMMVDSDSQRPMHGSAEAVDASFDAKGAPKQVVATGGVVASVVEQSGKGPGLRREIHGDALTATLVPTGRGSGARLSEVHVVGSARAHGESLVAAKGPPQVKTTEIAADDLRALFGVGPRGQSQMQHVFGAGHTTLEQDAPLGEQQTSAGDTLEIAFAPSANAGNGLEAGKIASAVQTGHVVLHSRAAAKAGAAVPAISTAEGDRATYNGAADALTVTGNAHFNDGVNSLTAAKVTLDQQSGDAEAQGNVVASVESAQKGTPAGAQSVTHVMAASAKFTRAGKLAEFRGSDAQPARLWQGPSQVQAAVLLFDGVRRTMSARPAAAGALIHAVFAGVSAQPGKEGAAAKPGARQAATVLRVASEKMDYADVQREATFAGKVRIEGSLGDVQSQRAVVMLMPETKGSAHVAGQPSPLGGSIDRVVVYGDVRMEQPGRLGTGDQLLYSAATDSFVLTGTPGHPPHVEDAEQGNVTGATLLFQRANQGADSTIVVAGEPPGTSVQGGRVRTETEVKRKN
jgi:lipopolysaccharide export system protein LptA